MIDGLTVTYPRATARAHDTLRTIAEMALAIRITGAAGNIDQPRRHSSSSGD